MATFTAKGVVSGAIFGAGLTAAGVYSPSVIISQMHLTNFHMLKVFIAASASSTIAILLAQRFAFSNCKPRIGSSIGIFNYDGNLIGGLMLGVGMTLTGACPGTVLPQVATGVPSAPLVLLGGVIGGTIWSGCGKSLLVKRELKENVEKQITTPATTVSQILGINERVGLVVYELICISIFSAATIYAPAQKSFLPPILGGLLIGTSQFASLILTANTLSISGAYEEIGNVIFYLLPSSKRSRPSITSIYFAFGTLLGSWTLGRALGLSGNGEVDVGKLQAVLGGAVMLFGSRLAGGCTSGHGISGMSMLSVASFVSVVAMFLGGMGLGLLLG